MQTISLACTRAELSAGNYSLRCEM